MPTIPAYTFRNSHEPFVEMLRKGGIDFSERPPRPGVIMASSFAVEMSGAAGASLFAAVAYVLVAWIRSRASRKIIINMNDGTVVHIEGMPVEDVQRVLELTSDITVIDTAPKEPEDQ
jgi:hypothetical protein